MDNAKLSKINDAGKAAKAALYAAGDAMHFALLKAPDDCAKADEALKAAADVYTKAENRYYWYVIYCLARGFVVRGEMDVPEHVAERLGSPPDSYWRIHDFNAAAGIYAYLGTQEALDDVMRFPVHLEDLKENAVCDVVALMDFIAAAI